MITGRPAASAPVAIASADSRWMTLNAPTAVPASAASASRAFIDAVVMVGLRFASSWRPR